MQPSPSSAKAPAPRWKSRLAFALKAGITLGLIALLLSQVPVDELGARFAQASYSWVLLSILFFLLQYATAAWRWHLVLIGLGERPSFTWVWLVCYLGLFFNQALPSAIGGDAVRVWHAYKQGQALSRAASGVLLDRAIGFLALFLLGVAALPMIWTLLPSFWLRWAPIACLLAAIAALAALAAISLLPQTWRDHLLLRGFVGLSRDTRLFAVSRQALSSLLVSLLSAVAGVAAFVALAKALALPLDPFAAAALVPLLLTLSALPISLGGWGVREASAVLLFVPLGLSEADALALALAYGAATVLTALPGGLALPFLKAQKAEAKG